MRRLVILGVLAALSCGSSARAECTPPDPPASERPAKPVPPERPRCADTTSCDAGEADRYDAAVAAFNDKAEIYARNPEA